MDELTIDELHLFRLQIFDNAESLYKEAKLLDDNCFYARAFLLAYFACEELGKIPIVVGVIGQLMRGQTINWQKTMRRFRSHKAKVDSDDFHQYIFGVEPDLHRNSDVKWLEKAIKNSENRVAQKQQSTYVDVKGKDVSSPSKKIMKEHASKMLERAFDSLSAHWHAESLTNPLVIEANTALKGEPQSRII